MLFLGAFCVVVEGWWVDEEGEDGEEGEVEEEKYTGDCRTKRNHNVHSGIILIHPSLSISMSINQTAYPVTVDGTYLRPRPGLHPTPPISIDFSSRLSASIPLFDVIA